MAKLKEIRQGDTVSVDIPLLQDGSPVDLSTAINVVAKLRISNVDVAECALNPTGTQSQCDIEGTGNNIVRCHLQYEQTKDFATGTLQASVVALMPPTAEFPDGERKEYDTMNVAIVRAGVLKDNIIYP